MNLDIALHAIPGYSIYHASRTAQSDAPFEVKVRDAVLASAVTSAHFLNATHHALKVQRLTMSAPGNLARAWQRIGWVARNPASGGLIVLGAGLILQTAVTDPTREFSPRTMNYALDGSPLF